MNFLAFQSMKYSLMVSFRLNKLTGRSSKECMHKFCISATLAIVFIRIALCLAFREYFLAGLTIAIWGILYPSLQLLEVKVFRKDFWDKIERSYQPPNIVFCQYVLPHYNWKARLFDVKMWMFFVLFQLFFTITSLLSTYYFDAVLSLSSSFLFFVQSLWSSNNFFYHQINNTSLYSKLKKWVRQKMENRKKVSILVPIPA